METNIVLGTDIETDQIVTIGSDGRARSTYVIGITGAGKSNLLETMAYVDMQNGDGLCFLDPHGDSAHKLLGSVPSHRVEDVIFWDPGDTEKPLGLNPFYCFDPTNAFIVGRIAESFVKALGSLKEFAETFKNAPRMKDLLEQLAITFVVNQGHTLAETPEFLTNQTYRQQFYPKLSQHFAHVQRYWENEFDALSPREQEERRASSLNKLRRFQTDPVLYGIFGQPKTTINFRMAMDKGEIIIVDLSADDQGFLGAFIVWGILQAARSRAKTPESERCPFHLFSDEFQTYMTTAFPTLQAEARKFGVDTVVAHQVREQLDPELRELTRAVGNLIIFRVTYPNAAALAGEFDTTPPPEPSLRRQWKLTLSPNPWGELLRKGHANPEVVNILLRLKKLLVHRNAHMAPCIGFAESGITVEVKYEEWQVKGGMDPYELYVLLDRKATEVYFLGTGVGYLRPPIKEISQEHLGEWVNPYLIAREHGNRGEGALEELFNQFLELPRQSDTFKQTIRVRKRAPYERILAANSGVISKESEAEAEGLIEQIKVINIEFNILNPLFSFSSYAGYLQRFKPFNPNFDAEPGAEAKNYLREIGEAQTSGSIAVHIPFNAPSMIEKHIQHLAWLVASPLDERWLHYPQRRAIGERLLQEVQAMLAPYKQRAVYKYTVYPTPKGYNDLSVEKQRDVLFADHHGYWEIAPFPEAYEWLENRLKTLRTKLESLTNRHMQFLGRYARPKTPDAWTPVTFESGDWFGSEDLVCSGKYAAETLACWRIIPLVKEQLAKEIKRLGDILANEPVMTESGQPDPIPERSASPADRAAEIANELVHLENFQARCKISQRRGRPTEHTILTLPFPGEPDASLTQTLIERSRKRFGRDRGDVERGIAQRLGPRPKPKPGNGGDSADDEDEPIIREKKRDKGDSPRRAKRMSEDENGGEGTKAR